MVPENGWPDFRIDSLWCGTSCRPLEVSGATGGFGSAKSGRPGLPFRVRSGTIGSMRNGILSMQGFTEILVGTITTRLTEPIDHRALCLTRASGYAARHPRNPARLLSTLRWAATTTTYSYESDQIK